MSQVLMRTQELSHEFAAMATDNNDEGPLTGINYDKLYSYHTRQTACKSTQQSAKCRKADSSRQRLGVSQGAYDSSDEVIKFMARQKKTKEERDRLVYDTQGQEGRGSTSSANTSQSYPQEKHWNMRSAYVSTIQAAQTTDSDTHEVQIQMASLVDEPHCLKELFW